MQDVWHLFDSDIEIFNPKLAAPIFAIATKVWIYWPSLNTRPPSVRLHANGAGRRRGGDSHTRIVQGPGQARGAEARRLGAPRPTPGGSPPSPGPRSRVRRRGPRKGQKTAAAAAAAAGRGRVPRASLRVRVLPVPRDFPAVRRKQRADAGVQVGPRPGRRSLHLNRRAGPARERACARARTVRPRQEPRARDADKDSGTGPTRISGVRFRGFEIVP